MLLSDRFLARVFLFLSFFAGLSLIGEMIFGAFSFWPLVILAVATWAMSGFWSAAAFQEMEGEIDPEGSLARPRFDFYLAVVVAGLASTHLLFYVFESHGEVWIRNLNLNGDLPFHWHMIKYLSRAPDFWPDNPLFGMDHLRYAFGVNWLSALLHRHGLPLQAVLVLPLFFSLWILFQQLWKWAGLWAVVAFFASGGGWWLPASKWTELSGPGDTLAWKNLFLSVLVTQRGFWVALPLGIFILRFLLELQRNPWLATPQKWRLLLALWAFLPFFHLHTFVVLSLFAVFSTALSPLRAQWRALLRQTLAWVWIPLLFLWQSISLTNAGASLRWVWNWMSDSQSLMASWGQNLGPWLLFVVFLLVASLVGLQFRGQKIVRQHEASAVFVWVALGVLFSHFMMAPWNWDQTKILLWIYLGLSVGMGLVLRRILPRAIALVLLVMLHVPGFVQFSGGLGPNLKKQALWTVEDQQAVQNLVSMLPVEERVLVAPSPHHPILATGQAIVAGYPGHLWSQGLSIQGLEDHLKLWMQDPADPALRTGPFQALKAQHLIWGPLERQWTGTQTPGGDSEGGKRWQKISVSGNWVLYKSSDYR